MDLTESNTTTNNSVASRRDIIACYMTLLQSELDVKSSTLSVQADYFAAGNRDFYVN